ncbi:MAG: hypothetical protein ACI3ZS_03185 [Candidatus Cryptobacteroides sp.]
MTGFPLLIVFVFPFAVSMEIKNITLADTWEDMLGLFCIGSITMTWAILSYRKTS